MTTAKNTIVTGSTSGIGLGIAKAFAEAGMNVMLNGLNTAEEVENIRSEIDLWPVPRPCVG